MATFTDPEDIEGLPAVLVYSDAPENIEAIKEIDRWAEAHNFVRTREAHLDVVLRQGRRLRKGFCYRLRDEDHLAAEDFMRRVRENRESMPMSADSAEILRSMQ